MVKVEMGKISRYIGVEIVLSGTGSLAPEAMGELVKRAGANGYSLMKQILVDHMEYWVELAKASGHADEVTSTQAPIPYLSVTLPCGTIVSYETAKDIPEVDVPCPCGDKSHWIIRYWDLRKEDTNGTKTNR